MDVTHRQVADQLATRAIQNDANKRLNIYEGVIIKRVCPKTASQASGEESDEVGRASSGSMTVRGGFAVSGNWLSLLATGVTDVWSRIRKLTATLVAETLAKEDGDRPAVLERRQMLLEQTLATVLKQIQSQKDTEEGHVDFPEDQFRGGSWFCAEGFLLLLNALKATVTVAGKTPLVHCISSPTRHVLLTKYVLPLAFHAQVPVRELAASLLCDMVGGGGGGDKHSPVSKWFSSSDDVESYLALIAIVSSQVLLRHVDQQQDPHSVACVEGVVTLKVKLGSQRIPISETLKEKLVSHDAAAIRHASAEYLSRLSSPSSGSTVASGEMHLVKLENDLLSALFELSEPVESALRSAADDEGKGIKWEVEETRLMALYLFVQRLVKQSTPRSSSPTGGGGEWPLPRLPLATATTLTALLMSCQRNPGRFEVKRIVGQLLPLWVQYLARLVPGVSGPETSALQTLVRDNFRSGGTVGLELALILDFFIALQKHITGEIATTNKRKKTRLSNALTSCGSTFVKEVYGRRRDTSSAPSSSGGGGTGGYPLLLAAWTKLVAGEEKPTAVLLQTLVAVTPDFIALSDSHATNQFLPLWVKAVALGHVALPSQQRVLLHCMQMLLLRVSPPLVSANTRGLHHTLFSTFLSPEMKPPMFEDDMEGVGQGLHYIRLNTGELPEVALGNIDSGSSEDTCPTLLLGVEALARALGSNPATEPAVMEHLRVVVLAFCTQQTTTITRGVDLITACTSSRLEAVCGSKWREGPSSSFATEKKASADDWDDSDDEDEQGAESSASPAGGDPVQGVSVPTELANCRQFWQQVKDHVVLGEAPSSLLEEDMKVVDALSGKKK